MLYTLIGMGRAAPAAAVLFPGMARDLTSSSLADLKKKKKMQNNVVVIFYSRVLIPRLSVSTTVL